MVEPANLKDYRRLCFELKLEENLPEFPMQVTSLPRVLEVISLAKQIDRASHQESRKKKDEAERKRIAQELDLPSESDEAEDAESTLITDQRRKSREEATIKQQRQKLARLLQQLEY